MTPKFVYFDLDDTLLDHKRAEIAALKDVYACFDVFLNSRIQDFVRVYHSVNKDQWRQYSSGQITRGQLQRNRFEQTLRQLKLDESRYEEIGSYYMQRYRTYWTWIDGAKEAFLAVCDAYEVGILTNGFSETQKLKFNRFDLNAYARHLVISEDVGALKPDPRIFKHATELTGCSASEILYVGDSYISDVVGGSQFGWKTAWYTHHSGTEEAPQADFIFSSFDELRSLLSV